ncbi:MAG: hypothetical protein J5716_07935, partial [Alphaproteobacteria bacterium]|nr:hypothetical protein [Alphaproteobacteria bacterium]
MSLFPETPVEPASVWQPSSAKKTFFKRFSHFVMFFFCTIGVLFSFVLTLKICSQIRRNTPVVFEEGTILRLNIDRELYEARPNDLVGSLTFGDMPTVADVVMGLHRAADDPNISTLIVYMTRTGLPLTQVQEIRSAIHALRKAGKKTIFYAPTFGELGSGMGLYYL